MPDRHYFFLSNSMYIADICGSYPYTRRLAYQQLSGQLLEGLCAICLLSGRLFDNNNNIIDPNQSSSVVEMNPPSTYSMDFDFVRVPSSTTDDFTWTAQIPSCSIWTSPQTILCIWIKLSLLYNEHLWCKHVSLNRIWRFLMSLIAP